MKKKIPVELKNLKLKKNMSNKDYHSNDALSCSGIKTIVNDSLYNYLNPDPNREPSKAMIMGSATHSFLLEKDKFLTEFYIMPKIDKRSKAGKEEFAWHNKRAEGKMIIDDDEYQILQKMEYNRDKIQLARRSCEGKIEQSYFGEYDGVKIKVRPDIIHESDGGRFIADIKTTRNIKPQAFKYECKKLGYHIQAHFYSTMLGFYPKAFRIIAIENVHPYKVDVFTLSDDLLEEGEMLWKNAVSQYKKYLETGKPHGHLWHKQNAWGCKIL